MKIIIALLTLFLIAQSTYAQNVRFTNGSFENGLMYPIADFSGNADAKTKLNENILEIVSVYKDQDYCISQHGFVQHNNFIQLNFYFNCIDMDESVKESHLFSLKTGEISLPSAMFDESEEKAYSKFLQKKISSHYNDNGKEAPSSEFLNELSIDDCNVNLLEKGIEITLNSQEDWPDASLLITWSELSPYLKHLRTR